IITSDSYVGQPFVITYMCHKDGVQAEPYGDIVDPLPGPLPEADYKVAGASDHGSGHMRLAV
ncbi:hypothetical protein A2U01_0068054, partial [Trifolium medium]|nr:hypothetical protein [Trifolium medium]